MLLPTSSLDKLAETGLSALTSKRQELVVSATIPEKAIRTVARLAIARMEPPVFDSLSSSNLAHHRQYSEASRISQSGRTNDAILPIRLSFLLKCVSCNAILAPLAPAL